MGASEPKFMILQLRSLFAIAILLSSFLARLVSCESWDGKLFQEPVIGFDIGLTHGFVTLHYQTLLQVHHLPSARASSVAFPDGIIAMFLSSKRVKFIKSASSRVSGKLLVINFTAISIEERQIGNHVRACLRERFDKLPWLYKVFSIDTLTYHLALSLTFQSSWLCRICWCPWRHRLNTSSTPQSPT